MGEYVKFLGQGAVKLGTCNSLYYTSYQKLRENIHKFEQDDASMRPGEYLNPEHGWLYRFPFPDEDDVQIGTHRDFDRGLKVSVVPGDPILLLKSDDHKDLCLRVDPVNVFVPCLASDKIKTIRTSPLPKYVSVEICQQKQVEGQLWTVVRCGWCKAAWRLPEEQGLWLAEHISRLSLDRHGEKFWTKVSERIAAGYRR